MGKTNFQIIRLRPGDRYLYDLLILFCKSSIHSGAMWVAAPAFSDSDRWVVPEHFPFEITLSHELAAEKRALYYTDDGSTPTNISNLYDESHIDIIGFLESLPCGSLLEIKAVAYEPVTGDYSTVASRKFYKMGTFLYSALPPEFWMWDWDTDHQFALEGGTIHSGALVEIVVVYNVDQEEPKSLELTGGTIDSGTYTEIVVPFPSDPEEEKNIELTGGIINQGKYWDPIVEIEPPWN